MRRYLRFNDLVARGLFNNRTSLARAIRAGRFPGPVELGPNSKAWPLDEVEAYEAQLLAARPTRNVQQARAV